jgi:hypothetical protein
MIVAHHPTDVWKVFADTKRRNKEAIAKWIEDASADARQLAQTWRDRVSSYEELPLEVAPQSVINEQIVESYKSASQVFEGRIPNTLQEAFASRTGSIIALLQTIKQLYERLYGKNKPMIFVDEEGNRNNAIVSTALLRSYSVKRLHLRYWPETLELRDKWLTFLSTKHPTLSPTC